MDALPLSPTQPLPAAARHARRRPPRCGFPPRPGRWSPGRPCCWPAPGWGRAAALTITAENGSQLSAPGGLATGNVTGMAGTYLALMMVLLVSRIPAIERVLGQDGLLRWRRRLAPWPISLPAAHSVLITAGYAQAARTGPRHEAGTLVLPYPDILTATVGLALMCLAGRTDPAAPARPGARRDRGSAAVQRS